MQRIRKTLSIESSPHIKSGDSVDTIMRNVVYALLPICGYSVYVFGSSAFLVLSCATLSCVLSEYLLSRRRGSTTIKDWSSVVTGILYGLTLPPHLPLWMVIIGGMIAIGVGKLLFGGLGYNPFNPALVGRAFLQAAFPVAMTSWLPALAPDRFSSPSPSVLTWPFASPNYDGISSATPLSLMKFEREVTSSADLFWGLTSGSAGETSSVLILVGGIYLALRKMLNWRIPVTIFLTVAALSALMHYHAPTRFADPLFMLFSGGLMLGAVFMATDMVASPMTNKGVVVYGVLIGALIVAIRYWGGMPEGVMYSILLANAVAPHIDRFTGNRVYGTHPRLSG